MVISNGMKLGGLGILVLSGLAASACSSSNTTSGVGGSSSHSATSTAASSGSTGGATTASSGSATTGTGGATSSSSTSTTSSTSSTSSGTAMGCTASDAPPSATILGAGDGGLSLNGGVITYGGTAAPTAATTASGSLVITESGAASATAAEYVGTVMYFSGNAAGTDCVKASTYTGVEFTISGSVAGCTVQFAINDSEHSAASAIDAKASGAAGSYAPSLPVTVTSTPTTIKVPFTGAGAPSGGMPAAALDPTKLEGIQWQYTIAAGAETCMSTLTITNIAFYP